MIKVTIINIQGWVHPITAHNEEFAPPGLKARPIELKRELLSGRLLLGAVIVMTEGSALAPFIYTLF